MTIDLKAIRAAAEAANQTKWKAYHDHGWLVVESDDGAVYVKVAKGSFALSPDAKHIATANPAAILELLDRLEAAEKDAADWRRRYEIERGVVEKTIVGGRYPDGSAAW